MKIKNIKKHREIIGTYIKCPQCGESLGGTTCRIYLEDRRYREECIRCGYTGLLSMHQLNLINKSEA